MQIRDRALAGEGERRIQWAQAYMPVLGAIARRFAQEKPLAGMRIALSIHLEAKTASLALALQAGGALVHVTGSNPLSTQDSIAAALAERGMPVFAWHGATDEEYWRHLNATLDVRPTIIVDDGGDLLSLLQGSRAELASDIIGGCEETTTGVRRLHALAAAGELRFPMVAVNDAACKHLFDNRYGTGQSVWDGIMRATNLLVAGKCVVVAGYGWCGRGVAMRAAALGAHVIVTEIDPVRAMEAMMDGHRVLPMAQAAPLGDFFVTVTGCNDVLSAAHYPHMKDGAVLCNAGHFDVEINLPQLHALSADVLPLREGVTGYRQSDGRMLCVLGEGRLVNLVCADGHPVQIMDLSFAVQALCVEYLATQGGALSAGVHAVPAEVDARVAQMALAAQGVAIDALTAEQYAYYHGK